MDKMDRMDISSGLLHSPILLTSALIDLSHLPIPPSISPPAPYDHFTDNYIIFISCILYRYYQTMIKLYHVQCVNFTMYFCRIFVEFLAKELYDQNLKLSRMIASLQSYPCKVIPAKFSLQSYSCNVSVAPIIYYMFIILAVSVQFRISYCGSFQTNWYIHHNFNVQFTLQ